VFSVNTYEPTHVAKIKVIAPTQKNSYDCGVFVLKYAQEILTNFAKILIDLAADKERPRDGVLLPRAITDDGLADLIPYDAFTPSDVTNKRTELQALLADDTKAYEAILDAKTEAKQAKAEV
jgi:Ulp1 family protease